MVRATEEEQATIRAMLSKRAQSAPPGAGVGHAPALAWAGLRLAAFVLLAAGVGVGLGDGDEFDDVGCSVAQQPGGTSHGARSAQARERAGGKLPGSDSGSAGASGDSGPAGRPECEARAAKCAHRMADGQCQRLNRQCRLSSGAGDVGAGKAVIGKADPSSVAALRSVESEDLEVAMPGVAARAVVKAVEAAIERILGGRCLADRHKGAPTAPQGVSAPAPSQPDEPNLSLAAKVLELLTALDPDNRLRKAPPIKVFLLRFRQNRSRSEIARLCHCGKSLVALRLSTIQQRLPWKPQQLQELSAHVEAMQHAVSDSRARNIHRKAAFYGDERGGEESG